MICRMICRIENEVMLEIYLHKHHYYVDRHAAHTHDILFHIIQVQNISYSSNKIWANLYTSLFEYISLFFQVLFNIHEI